MNKYLISIDIEGITGVVGHDYSSEKGKYYEMGCRYMEHDLRAVVEGLRVVDPTSDILVRDAHGARACNLNLFNLPDVSVLQGWDKLQNMLAGLDEQFTGVLLVGYHAGGDNPRAVLSHTMSSKVRYLKINGEIANEAKLFELYARFHRVPVIFLSGDDQVVMEAKGNMDPAMVKVCVKQSLGRACAVSQSLVASRQALCEGAKLAIQRLNKGLFKWCPLPEKLTLELGFHDLAVRRSLFTELVDTINFDKSYQIDELAMTISFQTSSLATLLARLNLLLRLLYSFTE